MLYASLRACGAPALLALALAACRPAAPTAEGAGPAATPTTPTAAAEQTAVAVDPSLPVVTVYKSPTCGCCSAWIDHLEADGFAVQVVDMPDVTPIKENHSLPRELSSCHTAVVGDYVVEGHVPAADIRRLLQEQPDAAGIAVPGMPIGSPGMEQGSTVQPYDVVLFTEDGQQSVFAHHGG